MINPPNNFTLFDMLSLESELKEIFNKDIDLVSDKSYTRDMYNEASEEGIRAKEIFYNNVINERKNVYG